jgi:hypothetical protein
MPLTTLSVNHVVPKSGFGYWYRDNIKVFCSPVVEHLPHHPMVKGASPATAPYTGREKMAKHHSSNFLSTLALLSLTWHQRWDFKPSIFGLWVEWFTTVLPSTLMPFTTLSVNHVVPMSDVGYWYRDYNNMLGSTMVEHLPHHPKVKGSSPAYVPIIGREKMAKD